MANEIVISEEEFDNISTTLYKSSSKTSYASQRLNGDFEGAVNSGLLGNSISVISRQMGLISKSMSNVQSIISEHSEQVLSFDRKLADKINEILIDHMFACYMNKGDTATDINFVNEGPTVLLVVGVAGSVSGGILLYQGITKHKKYTELLRDINNNVFVQ